MGMRAQFILEKPRFFLKSTAPYKSLEQLLSYHIRNNSFASNT